MRRREKFVISSIFLTFALWGVQFVSLDWKYLSIAGFSIISFFVSAWALADDLQKHEWLVIVPFPALYAGAVSLFYFLLPENIVTRVSILVLFGVGMYALLLTSNIFSVAKSKTIQLLYAASAIGLFFSLLTSLLYTNTIFSLKLPFYFNSLLIGLVHFPIFLMSFWSARLTDRIEKEIVIFSLISTLLVMEFAVIFSFLPLAVWHISLFIMSFAYLNLGIMTNFLKEKLFSHTIREYSLVGVFIIILFFLLFPFK
jgi:hypothetical protein